MKKPSDVEEEQIQVPPLLSFRSVRLRVVLLISFSIGVQGLARGSLGMAAVCFAPDIHANTSVSTVSQCAATVSTINSTETKKTKEYAIDPYYQVDWTASELSKIHTSFYIGSFISVFFVDRAIKRFGAKIVMAGGTIVSAVGSMVTPIVILYTPHHIFTIIVRGLMGIGYAFVIPCGSVIISRWFPLTERSTGMAIFTTGNQVGISIAMLFTAQMCELSFFGGWPLSFEAYGIVCWIFLALWVTQITNRPREHKDITACELEHITGKCSTKARAVSVVITTPYKKICLSPAVLAIGACSFAQSFVIISLVTYLPKYYQQALHIDLNANGFFSAAPFIVQIATKLAFAVIADTLKVKTKIDHDTLAKIFNAVACFGSGTCILLISFLGCEHSLLIMILMTASMGLSSGFVPGYNTSIVSVAPMFTATVSAFSQVFSQTGSALAPFIIGLTTQNGTIEEWQIVFYIITGILFVAGLTFQVFGKSRAEPWADFSQISHRSSLGTDGKGVTIPMIELPDDEPPSLLSLPKRTIKVSYNEVEEIITIPSNFDLRDPISDDDDDTMTVTQGMV